MSCNLEKDARLALFVEVEVSGTDVRVLRMVATGDFGAALNPDAPAEPDDRRDHPGHSAARSGSR